ncbi:UPF0149 family protein [Psychrobacter sp. HD31]|uniref:UPF0149 family protein n=1 Tax=Psychrobacter sp. HD31 TaxID=3112003 RepID=UPI003DA66A82
MNDSLSGWNDWQEAFTNWTDVSVSELHGLMTGLMTVCDAPNEKVWIKVLEELSFTVPEEKALSLLVEEAEDVAFQLKDKDDAYQFTPLVPDDENDLYERVQALKQWANGFLTGFGVSDCNNLSEQEVELLSDLARIGSIRINSDDEFEGGEESYLHLFEYVRMVPVSMATRKRKSVMSLPLIAGLPLEAKTANELAEKQLPPVVDATSNRPS